MNHFTFSWGHNHIAVRGLLRTLGHDLETPPPIDASTAQRGIELAHPFLCFSGKLVLGQLARQIERGGRRFVFMSSLGPEACRCADTAGFVEELFGTDSGFSAHRIGGSDLRSATSNLRRHFGGRIRSRDCVRAYTAFYGKLDLLHKIEKRCTALRCLSSTPRFVDEVEAEALERVDRANGPLGLLRTSRRFDRVARRLDVRAAAPSLRIGVVGGEHILSELGSIMAALRRTAERGMLFEWRGGFRMLARMSRSTLAPRKARCVPYLNEAPSTSEILSCADALDFIDEGVDGLLHVYAFGCMPQTALKLILQRIARDRGLPLLSLSIGDRFAEEGLENRLEAFVDLLESRRQRGVRT